MDTETIDNLVQAQIILNPSYDYDDLLGIYQDCAKELGLPIDPHNELSDADAEALYALAEDA